MGFLMPKPKVPPVRPPQVLVPQSFSPNPSQPARPMAATGGSNDSNFQLGTQTLINQTGSVAPAQRQRRTLLGGA
jgi:hypothetical protein